MEAGGTPLTRMFLILVLVAVPAALITIDHPAQAQESQAATLLKKGLAQLRAGDPDSVQAAIKTLRRALAANPSSEEAMAALGRAEWRALINLMASGREGANVAKALMGIAQPILPEKAFDEAELKKLVKTAVTSEDYGSRFDASVSLARVYGEFAVPPLLAYLASSKSDYKIQAHITLMNRLGRDAVLPLDEALQSDDAGVRFMVASELGVIGDERSLGAIAEAAGDADENVRGKAAEAWQKMVAKFPWAADMSASDLYLRLARYYYSGSYRVMGYTNRPLVLWNWSGGLKNQAVPRHLYLLKLAEEAAFDAIRVDPSNGAARAMLARILASEKLASDAMASRADDELSSLYAAGLASAKGTVAAMGFNILSTALGDALDHQDFAVAGFLLQAMPMVYGGADFTTDNPVVRAATAESAAARLAAAEAVLRFNGRQRISAFPDPDGFINLVAQAVGEIVPRHVLVVDGNDERRNKLLTDLNTAKYIAFDARTGSDGIVRATRFPGLDLIVLSTDLVDMDPLEVLHRLAGDDRTKDIPVVMVGSSEQAANDKWRGLYKDKVKGLAGVPEGAGMPSEEFAKVVAESFGSQSPDVKARYAHSANILAALAETDTGNALFNWNALSETLTALLASKAPDDPPVKMNALHALANLADPASLGALTAYFAAGDNAAHKAAAGNAIAAILQANPMGLEAQDFAALLKGTQSDDEGVRTASFAALGSAQLTDEQANAVATANRPGAAAGGM